MPQAVPIEDLVGRDRLLDRLGVLIGRVLDGHRVTVLVAGEAGIGKTSLIRAAAAIAAEKGALTAWGTCVDVDGGPRVLAMGPGARRPGTCHRSRPRPPRSGRGRRRAARLHRPVVR